MFLNLPEQLSAIPHQRFSELGFHGRRRKTRRISPHSRLTNPLISAELRQIQKHLGRSSLIGDQPFFSRAEFPWARELEENWQVIREELDVVLQHREDLPNFQDISPDQKHLAKEDKWKTFFFFAYGLNVPANAARYLQSSGTFSP